MPADPAPSHGAALFDQAQSRSVRGRRRPAPDWGGDDLFDHVPRRRFARTGDERRRSGPEPAARRAPHVEPAPPAPRPEPVQELVLARRAEYETMSPPPVGRRTIAITGRPGHGLVPSRPRESRTVEQRLVASPDRIAALAFALGLLLIVIALATSG